MLVGVSRHGERRQRMTTRHVGGVCESRCGRTGVSDIRRKGDSRQSTCSGKVEVRHCADGGASRHANYLPRGDRSDKDKGKKGIVLQKSPF
jgi:hypothetical protein